MRILKRVTCTQATAYDATLRSLEAEGRDAETIFDALAIANFRDAAGLFLPVCQRSNGADGDLSIEISPRLAHDTAKLAYELFQETFDGPVFTELAAKGAQRQRPLWASTDTKKPKYPDTHYVDALVGPDSVKTASLRALARGIHR